MANKLTTRQIKAISALLSAPDRQAAAELAGVAYRTINHYLTDDLFMAELRQAEGALIGEAVRGLVADHNINLMTMRDIRDNPRNAVNVRLRACQIIDQSLLKWREALDVEQRLEALEKVVNNGK